VNLVVVAKDSGTPPRETSVPVVIHFPNQEVASLKQKENEAFTLTVKGKTSKFFHEKLKKNSSF